MTAIMVTTPETVKGGEYVTSLEERARRPAIAYQQLPTDASVGDPLVRLGTRRWSAARFQLAERLR
jgi:hypothetical protein